MAPSSKSVPMKTTSCRRSPNSPSNGCRSATYASLASSFDVPSAESAARITTSGSVAHHTPIGLRLKWRPACDHPATLRCWVSSHTAPFDRSTRANVPSLAPSASAASAAAPGAPSVSVVSTSFVGSGHRRTSSTKRPWWKGRRAVYVNVLKPSASAELGTARASCACDGSVHSGSEHASPPPCECSCAWS